MKDLKTLKTVNFPSVDANFIEICDSLGKGLGTEIGFGVPVKVSQIHLYSAYVQFHLVMLHIKLHDF